MYRQRRQAPVGANYSVMQILAVRGWVLVFAMVLMLPRVGGLNALKTIQHFKHLISAVIGFAGPNFFISSLKELGIVDATVIFLVQEPF